MISDSNLLSDVAYVLCLDSIGSGDDLYLHVSKPPREDTPGGVFLQVSCICVIHVSVFPGIVLAVDDFTLLHVVLWES